MSDVASAFSSPHKASLVHFLTTMKADDLKVGKATFFILGKLWGRLRALAGSRAEKSRQVLNSQTCAPGRRARSEAVWRPEQIWWRLNS